MQEACALGIAPQLQIDIEWQDCVWIELSLIARAEKHRLSIFHVGGTVHYEPHQDTFFGVTDPLEKHKQQSVNSSLIAWRSQQFIAIQAPNGKTSVEYQLVPRAAKRLFTELERWYDAHDKRDSARAVRHLCAALKL